MANTYSQAYFHLVFAPKHRQAFIHSSWREDLHKYITAIIQNRGHKLIAIYAMPDHIHLFIGYNLTHLIPDLVQEVKTSSTHWINNQGFINRKFEWQKGYGAFSHSHSKLSTVANYVMNQEAHHAKKSFRDEYLELLKKHQIEFKNEYVFEFFN